MAVFLRGGVYHWRKTINGHILSRSTKTADKKVAERMAAVWEGEAVSEIVVRGVRPMSLHAVITAFLDSKAGTAGAENAEVHLRHFRALPNVRMNELTFEQLQAVITKRREAGISHNTLSVTVNYWNGVVNFAESRGWTTGPKLPSIAKVETRIRYLSMAEENALLAAIDPAAPYPGKGPRSDQARANNTDLLIGLLYLGCRYRELARMTWDQVDLHAGTVLVLRVKGGVDGTLVMPQVLRAMFERRKATATDKWVFPTKCRHNNNFKWLSAACERAGIEPITLHVCRHTAASRWLQHGLNLLEVKQMLGHRNIASTMVYAHVETTTVATRAAAIFNALAPQPANP